MTPPCICKVQEKMHVIECKQRKGVVISPSYNAGSVDGKVLATHGHESNTKVLDGLHNPHFSLFQSLLDWQHSSV